MEMDPEIKAMDDVYTTLKDLSDDAKKRVIEWVIGKFSLSVQKQKIGGQVKVLSQESGEESMDITALGSLAEIFGKASPNTGAEKVLIAATYIQEAKGNSELTGGEINRELKHLGHGVGNITNAINILMSRKPQLMIQIRKEGKTKQAQKKYKVTAEGMVSAKKMISGASSDQE